MQYLSRAYQYYSGINPATLTGAIDVIVVEKTDENNPGETILSCSPFHVRFGKLQVLRAGEKRVTLSVNSEPSPFWMKVGDAGEAFFVIETNDDVPDDLLTSPILGATKVNSTNEKGSPNLAYATSSSLSVQAINDRKTLNAESKEELAKLAADGELQYLNRFALNEPDPLSEEPDFLDLNSNSNAISSSSKLPEDPSGGDSSSSPKTPRQSNYSTLSPEDPPKFFSDDQDDSLHPSDILASTAELGGSILPKATHLKHYARGEKIKDAVIPFRKERRAAEAGEEEDVGDAYLPKPRHGDGVPPDVVYGNDVVLDMSGYKQSKSNLNPQSPTLPASAPGDVHEKFGNTGNTGRNWHTDLTRMKSELEGEMELDADDTTRNSIVRFSQDLLSSSNPSVVRSLTKQTRERANTTSFDYSKSYEGLPPTSNDDGSSNQRGLDSLGLSSGPEYSWDWGGFPQRSESASGGEVTSSSIGKLKNDESDPYKFILETEKDVHTFQLSLCGEDSFNAKPKSNLDKETTSKEFESKRITFRCFIQEPEVVESKLLVIQIKNTYLTWTNASPVLAVLIVFRKSIASPTANNSKLKHTHSEDTSTSGNGWTRWLTLPSASSASQDSNEEGSSSPQLPPSPLIRSQSEPPLSPPLTASSPELASNRSSTHFAKTLRLSSDQLKALKLKKGANTVTFSVTSSYSGLATCAARIFLWEASDHVVISDIDGTITKSDALGHVFAAIGRDWTHLGVAKLYTDVTRNGYKIMYLTARAIGQADSTRDYLKGISQGPYQLPEGPVIMSPDRLMASLHREVIMKKPEVFKMACLRDIQRLFGANKLPFYAGFGNRITDAMSYRTVGIPSSRIFTIDSSGEVKTELLELAGHKSSYIYMNDLVDEMFPPVNTRWAPEFTDFNFWKAPDLDIQLPDLSPPSPALSARSDGSGRLSVLRNLTLGRRSSRSTVGAGDTALDRNPSPRPSSPLRSYSDIDGMSEDEDNSGRGSRASSMPGSFQDEGFLIDDNFTQPPLHIEGQDDEEEDEEEEEEEEDRNGDEGHWNPGDDLQLDDTDELFEEMKKTPF